MLEPTLQTSFIPKKSLKSAVVGREATSLFLVVTLVLFLASAAVAGGVYANKIRLQNSITGPNGLTNSLKLAREAFDKDLLEAITRFDAKLVTGSELLNKHITLVPLFTELNKDTLETVRFTSFNFSFDAGLPKLTLNGEAKSFQSIALQSDSFVASRKFKDVIFSGLDVDNKGRVTFELSMKVDPTLISYIETKRK